MRTLIYTSPTYNDNAMIASTIVVIIEQSGGELVEVFAFGNGAAVVQELVEAIPETGLTFAGVRGFPYLFGLDEVIHLWQWPEYAETLAVLARKLGITVIEVGDVLASQRGTIEYVLTSPRTRTLV